LTPLPPVPAVAADSAAAAPDAARVPPRWLDNADWPAPDANAAPPHDMLNCNTGSADTAA
jgi:hypothetical protein